jgi:hypothetical protein
LTLIEGALGVEEGNYPEGSADCLISRTIKVMRDAARQAWGR